ncbi:DNA replication protein [Aeribacillus sp. FSL K6-1121]|uniref:DNA replication protein n=1 Tax=Aeribacillus sp. FSL K6-1121 TaxID=2954745 RepID=UPI0030F8A90E
MTNEKHCLLAYRCQLAGGSACNNHCPHFIALHGMNAKGGRVGLAGVPSDYRLVTLTNSPVRASQPKIYEMLDKYAATFGRQFDENGDRIKSVYMWSNSPGTGKTTTAVALLNDWLVAHYLGSLKRGRQPLQMPAYFLDVNEWQTLYNEFNRSHVPEDIAERASREYYRQLQAAKQAPFAVLDDIGVRQATEGFRGDLHAIINYRVTNGLPTVYTSNLPIEDMVRIFDERLYDRMRDMCVQLHFEGESKRGKRRG